MTKQIKKLIKFRIKAKPLKLFSPIRKTIIAKNWKEAYKIFREEAEAPSWALKSPYAHITITKLKSIKSFRRQK